jgi:hypothetical protein
MRDWIGWTATALFAFSYFAKNRQNLLVLQIVAASVWIGYGLLLGAAPVVAANVVVAAAAGFTVIRGRMSAARAGEEGRAAS